MFILEVSAKDVLSKLVSFYEEGALCNCTDTEEVYDEDGFYDIDIFHESECEALWKLMVMSYEV